MEPLVIDQTDSTLGVHFAPPSGTLVMRGESYPENALKFFAPIFEWLQLYFSSLEAGSSVTVDLDIIYFNSSSSKVLMDLFDTFDAAAADGITVAIFWRYHEENEIAQECGEEFGEDLDHASFSMIAYTDSEHQDS